MGNVKLHACYTSEMSNIARCLEVGWSSLTHGRERGARLPQTRNSNIRLHQLPNMPDAVKDAQ
jgi:hypothetical protein